MERVWYNVLINTGNSMSIGDVPSLWKEDVSNMITKSYNDGIIDRLVYSKAMGMMCDNLNEPESVDSILEEYL